MIMQKSGSLPLWNFDHLFQYSDISHYVSSREGGVSEGKYATLNLGYTSGDYPGHVNENRRRLAEAMDTSTGGFIFPEQVHGKNIQIINSREDLMKDIKATDGLITQIPGICISVLTADCVPVIFFDPKVGVVGVAHAGWRGTVKNISGKMIERFVEEFNSNPSDILAGIGPSIGPEVYEVGTNVIEAVQDQFGDNAKYLLQAKGNRKASLDLWKANRLQLKEKGVPENNIETAAICTYTHYKQFFSARKSGIECGRFGSGIMLKNEF